MTDNNKNNGRNPNYHDLDDPQQLPDERDDSSHWVLVLVSSFKQWLINCFNRVKNALVSKYDSKHFPVYAYGSFMVLNLLFDGIGWFNLFIFPEWVWFGPVVGGLTIVISYYGNYYHMIYYKVSNAVMEGIKITEHLKNRMTIIFTGRNHLENDEDVEIRGNDSLPRMEASGDSIGGYLNARGVQYGDDPDNDLDDGQIALEASPDEMIAIETGVQPDEAESLKQALAENNEYISQQKSKDYEDYIETAETKEALYQKILKDVIDTLQDSDLMRSDVSVGEIMGEIHGEDHFMAESNDGVVDIDDLNDKQRKQLYAELGMAMSEE